MVVGLVGGWFREGYRVGRTVGVRVSDFGENFKIFSLYVVGVFGGGR